ncbi:MAG: HisA/HisF-related TIM barrel protein, partial [Gemmatimonadota bacterium]
VVVAIDAYRLGEAWRVRVSGGAEETDVDAVAWAARAAELGAGEVLLTSIDRDGTRNGYDVELLRAVTEVVDVPVIASGGAGRPADFLSAFRAGASGALAASLFHSRELTILELKRWLASQGAQVRSVTGSDRSMRTNG